MESEDLFLCQGFQISGPGMQIHGNPGDYAWGRGGLDAIITQVFFLASFRWNTDINILPGTMKRMVFYLEVAVQYRYGTYLINLYKSGCYVPLRNYKRLFVRSFA